MEHMKQKKAVLQHIRQMMKMREAEDMRKYGKGKEKPEAPGYEQQEKDFGVEKSEYEQKPAHAAAAIDPEKFKEHQEKQGLMDHRPAHEKMNQDNHKLGDMPAHEEPEMGAAHEGEVELDEDMKNRLIRQYKGLK